VLTASASRLPLHSCPAAWLGAPHLCSCSCKPRNSPPPVSNHLCFPHGAVNALNRMKPTALLYVSDRQPHGWSRVCTAEMAATGLGTLSFHPSHMARDDYMTALRTATTTASRALQVHETISSPAARIDFDEALLGEYAVQRRCVASLAQHAEREGRK
jgi:hypothetical protein